MPDLSVSLLQPGEEGLWDRFVQNAPDAGFFHLLGWKNVVERTYGHRTHYLIARAGEEVRGVLPLFILQNRFFGTHVSSPPGAISALDEAAGRALLDAAMALAEEVDADDLLLSASTRVWDGDLITIQRHCTQRIALPDKSESLWKTVSRHKRKNINKAERSGVTATIGGEEQLDFFYEVFAQNLRDLGTPVFAKSLVQNIFREFPDQTHIVVTEVEGKPVGALLFFTWKELIHAQWAATFREFRDFRPNDMLYWAMLKWGCENGYRVCDTGRSQWGSGNFKFKELWGAEPVPLYYQSFMRRGTSVPDFELKVERDFKFRFIVQSWQRLPVPVTRLVGPYLRKNLYPL